MEKLYLIIPAYNEEENIERLVEEWYPIVDGISSDSRMVIINDGSKDNTYKILQELALTRPKLVPLTKENGGHGPTLLYGYRYAIEQEADYIFQTDADGQTNPDEFGQFWEQRKDYDAIIGRRDERGDGEIRKFVEKVVCMMLRLFFGVKVSDAHAPFRLMKSSLVSKYIDKMPENYVIPNIMFVAYFVYNHEKVKFIPITFKPRQGGVNSMNIKKIFLIGWHSLGDFYRLRKNMES